MPHSIHKLNTCILKLGITLGCLPAHSFSIQYFLVNLQTFGISVTFRYAWFCSSAGATAENHQTHEKCASLLVVLSFRALQDAMLGIFHYLANGHHTWAHFVLKLCRCNVREWLSNAWMGVTLDPYRGKPCCSTISRNDGVESKPKGNSTAQGK